MITTPIDWASERIAKKLTKKIKSMVDDWVTAKLGREPTDKEMWINGVMKVYPDNRQVYCWEKEEFLEVQDKSLNSPKSTEMVMVVDLKYLVPISEKN